MSKKHLNEQERLNAFMTELSKLTKTYGIALQVTGGVYIHDEQNGFQDLEYFHAETCSHDILPNWDNE